MIGVTTKLPMALPRTNDVIHGLLAAEQSIKRKGGEEICVYSGEGAVLIERKFDRKPSKSKTAVGTC